MQVSALALVYRLHEIGLLTEWRRRDLLIQLTQMGYRSGEPNGIERESSQLLSKVFESLKAESVPVKSLARCLRISMTELSGLTFGLTPVPLQGGGRATGTRDGQLSLVK